MSIEIEKMKKKGNPTDFMRCISFCKKETAGIDTNQLTIQCMVLYSKL